jgi:N-acetylglutamate synthase
MAEESPTRPIIRIMHTEDYRKVYALWSRCTGFSMKDEDDSEDAIHAFLDRNPGTCFVAEDAEGNIIGAILAGTDGRRSRIYHTAVDANARGMGIGTLLVNHVADALRSLGLPKIAVGVLADNTSGNEFWEGQGFAIRDDLIYRELPL